MRILEQEPPSPELARAVGSMCQMHMLASEYDDCLTWGERALALAAAHGADDVRVHTLISLGTVYVMLGTPERGLAMLQESLDAALKLGLPHDAARGYLNLAECLITVARYRDALEQLEAMIAYTSRMYVRGFTWTAAIRLAEVHWLIGHWQDALRILSEQVEGNELRGGMAGLWARTLRGKMWIDVGLVSPARDLLREELANVMATGEIQTIGPHLGQLVRAYAALGDQAGLQATTESLRTAIDRNPYLERDSVPALLSACRARIELPSDTASEAAETWLTRLERAEQQLRSPETHASLHEAVGLLALASGSPEHALEPLRTAVSTWESIERSFDAARARVDYARALVAAGHPDEAQRAFEQSSTSLSSLAGGLPEGEMRQAFDRSPLVLQAHSARPALPTARKGRGNARTPPRA
jgi:tetratricopeptide (TPR) repeat protein